MTPMTSFKLYGIELRVEGQHLDERVRISLAWAPDFQGDSPEERGISIDLTTEEAIAFAMGIVQEAWQVHSQKMDPLIKLALAMGWLELKGPLA